MQKAAFLVPKDSDAVMRRNCIRFFFGLARADVENLKKSPFSYSLDLDDQKLEYDQ